jgi:hypothetical protein
MWATKVGRGPGALDSADGGGERCDRAGAGDMASGGDRRTGREIAVRFWRRFGLADLRGFGEHRRGHGRNRLVGCGGMDGSAFGGERRIRPVGHERERPGFDRSACRVFYAPAAAAPRVVRRREVSRDAGAESKMMHTTSSGLQRGGTPDSTSLERT